ncbi:matrin 3-like 1.1 [Enoplosus armatus]|uniref:matrin 3-like 1.1 n=1 Tax=Enoplosus armatus TaxID=215367 RepID=UPI003994DBF1
MSHNYPYRQPPPDSNLSPDPGPYRQPPPDSDLRPDPGPYSSSDRCVASLDHNFYRAPQESFSSSYPSSSSSRGGQWSQDGALSILSSCGLEPSDLALLAELPEDVLTVESLPHVLKQIKGKRGAIKPFPPTALPSSSSSSSSYPPSSAHRPVVGPSSSDWDHHCSQPVQYPLDQVTPSPLPFEQDLDRWGNPKTSSTVRADPPSSSSSSYMVDSHRPGPSEFGKTGREAGRVSSQDFNHRPRPSEFGKTGRDASPVSSQDRSSFSSAERGKRNRSSRFSQPGPADHRSVPPPEECHLKTHGGRRETSSIRSSSRPAASMPSKKEAKDFHGTSPLVFPYSCSLCDITVMSEKVWIKHINGTQHADGQLSLLQQFPNWDCRMETVSGADSQSEWKNEGKPGRQPETANQNSKSQPNKKTQKKTSEKGKVVCVKFPAQSVDETYLRKLTEPFGKVVKILMFPSLAFVELGSIDQAKDLVKFHVNYPPTVNGEQMEFRISNTFTFLQSSRVVSFFPPPTGENGQSDLFSIIKRFGLPLYTLFLPSMAFVEMKNTPDAQKMVDYYSSNTLRINNDVIKVSFSGEYKSLMRVASAKRYEEESCSAKRTRSSSPDKEDKTTETKRRRSSKDREEERKEEEEEGGKSSRRTRTRSESREKSTKEKTTRTRARSREKSSKEKMDKTRSRSREKSSIDRGTRTRSTSRERSTEEKTTRTRSRSREKATKEKMNRSRSRSRSRDKSSRDRRTISKSISREKLVAPEKTEMADMESRTEADPAPAKDSRPEAEEREPTEEEAESSAEESDIEGMEVIGEDGENLEDEDVEEEKEEEDKAEAAEKDNCPAERTDSTEEDKEKEVKDGEADDQEQHEEEVMEKKTVETKKPINEKDGEEEEEEEQEKPLKEEEEEPESNREAEDDEEEPGFPVDLENCITLDELEEDESADQDEEVRDEYECPSTRVLYFRNLPLRFFSDTEFIDLVKDFGTAVRYYRVHERREGFIEMSTSSEALRAIQELICKPVTLNTSKLLVQISNQYKRLTNGWSVRSAKDSKKTPEKESVSKTANDESSEKESASRNSPEKDASERKTPEKESISKETLEKESYGKKNQEKEPLEKTSRKTPEKELANKKTSEKESSEEKDSAETESAAKKILEKESLPSQEYKTLKRERTHENDSVTEKKEKKKKESLRDESQRKQGLEAAEAPEEEKEVNEMKRSQEETSEPGLKDSEKNPDQPDSTGDPPKPQTGQKPAADERLQDSQVQVEQLSGPAGTAADLQRPTKPVGVEFVRPVVGYFCNLCQLIYADEDEAKLQHCSSRTHYRKYQEKTGKDPWAS